MSGQPVRYDTLVIRGSTSKEVPREAAGGEVVAWSAGHALAEHGPLEEFVSGLANGDWHSDVEAIATEAKRVLELSRRQRDEGWIASGQEKSLKQKRIEQLLLEADALLKLANRYVSKHSSIGGQQVAKHITEFRAALLHINLVDRYLEEETHG